MLRTVQPKRSRFRYCQKQEKYTGYFGETENNPQNEKNDVFSKEIIQKTLLF